MKRSGIAFCVNLDPRRFDHYVYRDQLPFPAKEAPAQYSLAEAFALRVFLDAIEEGGVSIELAQHIATSGPGRLLVHPLNQKPGEADLWVGAALIRDPDLGEGDAALHSFTVAGTLAELVTQAEARAAEHGPQANLIRLVTVNASRAARSVRSRANEMGLPEARDHSEIVTQAAFRKHWAEQGGAE